MQRRQVDIRTADGVADAYLVTPDEPGPHPGVLLFMDAFGLRPQIMEMATRIASRGYAVLAPNLLYRGQRSPLVTPDELADEEKRGAAFGRVMPMIQELTAERVIADSRVYLDYLGTDGPVGLVGYCMGGRNALVVAGALGERIAALGSFHAGRVVTEGPDSPHLGVGSIVGEVYFGHADNDGSMTPDDIAALEAAFEAAGVRYTSEVYAGAPHGFTMADTAMHDPDAEVRHWDALFGLLGRALPVA
jgi:carboxymethylenebutenolidase